jgi:catechol 2,3-dioxygenase-like lactoylglutathione lyase family enzyme
MLAFSPINGFVRTRNSTRTRNFYEGALGLSFILENEHVTVFRGGGSMVIAQKVKDFEPALTTVMGWEVRDIRDTVSSLQRKGIIFEKHSWMRQDALGICEGPDGPVAWFKDPDGNMLSLSGR